MGDIPSERDYPKRLNTGVNRFGIKTTLVAPGQFRTDFMNSIQYVKHRIAAYGVDEMEEPPLHLLLGPDTYDLVLQKRKEEAAEFEQWRALTLSTNFD